MKIISIFSIIFIIFPLICISQNNFGNNWIMGFNSTETSGTLFDFNITPVSISAVQKEMFLEGSIAVMSDSAGDLLFYSNGCYIANKHHELMINGDSIGNGKLETSFCDMGGNPMTQGIIALPGPLHNNLYYLFYTDIQSPYEFPTGLYFPLAPLNLYYALIDINSDNGNGAVILKNQVLVSDTLSRGMIQAVRHQNNHDWWLIMPKSHSNCYYTMRLSNNGIDTLFLQCVGSIWNDRDATGQTVFSPNRNKYVRFNFFNGLNIFDFDPNRGLLSNHLHIGFDQDTFLYSGTAFSSNSRFLYATAFDKVYQFDIHSSNVETSKTLIAELDTPPDISVNTRFNQALLAPDGRIYIGGTATFIHLHVILNPNCKGTNCNLEQYGLETFSYNVYGMPNMPNYIDWSVTDSCDSTVNIAIDYTSSEFKVFPNPFNDIINIEGELPIIFEIYNSTGKCIFRNRFEHRPISFSLNSYPDGLYIYRILKNNEIKKQEKLIKIE